MFRNRADAALQLAATLKGDKFTDPLVLAIPCGGAVVGAIVARELNAELDVVLFSKLRAHDQPELTIGAISESGHLYMNDVDDEAAEFSDQAIHRERERQLTALRDRSRRIRNMRPKAAIQNRSVIVVDDGIATGATMIAALQTIRPEEPAELIVAVPVASADQLRLIRQHCDRVVCPMSAKSLWNIGQFYHEFPRVDEQQAMHMIKTFQAQARVAK